MNYILFDGQERLSLLPMTFTRPVADIRVGALTIREKWAQRLAGNYSYMTEGYLAEKYPLETQEDNVVINAGVIPNADLTERVSGLKTGERLIKDKTVVAYRISGEDFLKGNWSGLTDVTYESEIKKLDRPFDIFMLNGEEIKADLELLKLNKSHADKLGECNRMIGSDLYVGESVEANDVTFNTKTGPIVIDDGALIMEGAMLRGPLYIGKNAVVKMGAKVYADTTIGPFCKVGGEVQNVVFQGYSNKGHDGYLGNSVIGEWCNLGADTNSSNLKNNYSHVKVFDYRTAQQEDSGLQFCGLIMGDHSKTGINTMLNTGTTVGVAANIFGGNFPPKFVPSFSWGGFDKTTFDLGKSFEVAEKVMSRRSVEFTDQDKAIFRFISEFSARYRQ